MAATGRPRATAHWVAWWVVTSSVVALGLLGTPGVMDWSRFLATVLALAVMGAATGLSFAPAVGAGYVRAGTVGLVLFAGPCLEPGLWHVTGPASLVLGGLVALTPPPVVQWGRRLLRGRVLPTETEAAAMASPDDALRRQWTVSTTQLRDASTDAERLLLVRMRAAILDDLAQRSDGVLPDYVWASVQDDTSTAA